MARRTSWPIALAVVTILPGTARAMGAVVGKEGEVVGVGAERIAVATAAGQRAQSVAVWSQVSVVGASAGFVWIVPVPPGGRVNLASDAWLDALDAATSAVVLPPAQPNQCDAGVAPQVLPPTTSPASSRPTATALFTDLPSLSAFVSGAGYAIPADLAAALPPLFAAGTSFVASTYESSSVPTRTIRVVAAAEEQILSLPLALTRGTEGASPLTAFVIASESATAGSSPLVLNPATVLWEGDGASSYAASREALLARWQGTRWLTESTLPDLLFDGAPVAASAPLPSVLAHYFSLAEAYGDTTLDPAACTAAALATRAASETYDAHCPPGALAVAPGVSPCALAASTDGGTSSDALLCGPATDDAALAVAGLSPTNIWVTRLDGLLIDPAATDIPLTLAAAAPASPVVTAADYATTCAAPPAAPPPPAASIPSSGAPTSGSSSQSSNGSSSSASDVAPAAAEGCGAAFESCGGRDSSTDDEDDDDSGGCGSSDHKSDDDDSNSSGGCGSSDSTSDDSNSSSCETSGHTRARMHGHSPVSRILLGLVALAAFARRRARAV